MKEHKKRINISKKLRFQVFERDNFTCQYCGRTPENDEVILEVDHIISVKDGGGNQIENLVTSCFDCNRGKGCKSKPKKTIKQIEENIKRERERIQQLKAFQKKRKILERLKNESELLKNQWIFDIIGDGFAKRIYEIINDKLKTTDKEIIVKALKIIKEKDFETINEWHRYFNGILRNLNIPEDTAKLLKFFDYHIEKPYSSGRYNWRLKESYDAVRKIIIDYSDWLIENDTYKIVIKKVELILKNHGGETFKLRDKTMEYVNKKTFTVYKSGENKNLLIADTIFLVLNQKIWQ